MKLYTLLMAVGFAVTAMPATAHHTAGMNISDTTEIKTAEDFCPVGERHASQQNGTRRASGSDLLLSQKEKMRMPVIRNYICASHPDNLRDTPGRCLECGSLLHLSSKEKTKGTTIGLYACVLHPAVTGKKGSPCAQCGKRLKTKHHSSLRHPNAARVCINSDEHGNCGTCKNELLRSPKEKMKMDQMKICCCNS